MPLWKVFFWASFSVALSVVRCLRRLWRRCVCVCVCVYADREDAGVVCVRRLKTLVWYVHIQWSQWYGVYVDSEDRRVVWFAPKFWTCVALNSQFLIETFVPNFIQIGQKRRKYGRISFTPGNKVWSCLCRLSRNSQLYRVTCRSVPHSRPDRPRNMEMTDKNLLTPLRKIGCYCYWVNLW